MSILLFCKTGVFYKTKDDKPLEAELPAQKRRREGEVSRIITVVRDENED